jgi:hypothetical protein
MEAQNARSGQLAVDSLDGAVESLRGRCSDLLLVLSRISCLELPLGGPTAARMANFVGPAPATNSYPLE